jgi:predicted nuclease of restriction endonuclease-like (RecB) superfamily
LLWSIPWFHHVAHRKGSHERQLETVLVRHLEKFLLELGEGFAFIGHMQRSGKSLTMAFHAGKVIRFWTIAETEQEE